LQRLLDIVTARKVPLGKLEWKTDPD